MSIAMKPSSAKYYCGFCAIWEKAAIELVFLLGCTVKFRDITLIGTPNVPNKQGAAQFPKGNYGKAFASSKITPRIKIEKKQ